MTTEAKHTPGPWQAWEGRVSAYERDAANQDVAVVVADCLTRDLSPGRCDANAQLIAAAPQMLEALRQACATIAVLKTFCTIPLTTVRSAETERHCEAAILAATGGSDER